MTDIFLYFLTQLHDSKIDYERSLSELQSHSICRDRDNQLEISEMTSRHELTLDQLKQRHEEMIDELKRNVKQIDRDNTVSVIIILSLFGFCYWLAYFFFNEGEYFCSM